MCEGNSDFNGSLSGIFFICLVSTPSTYFSTSLCQLNNSVFKESSRGLSQLESLTLNPLWHLPGRTLLKVIFPVLSCAKCFFPFSLRREGVALRKEGTAARGNDSGQRLADSIAVCPCWLPGGKPTDQKGSRPEAGRRRRKKWRRGGLFCFRRNVKKLFCKGCPCHLAAIVFVSHTD